MEPDQAAEGSARPRENVPCAVRRRGSRGERLEFRVLYEPDGSDLLVRIPELELVTQADIVVEVGRTARDLIALWLQVSPEAFDIEVGGLEAGS